MNKVFLLFASGLLLGLLTLSFKFELLLPRLFLSLSLLIDLYREYMDFAVVNEFNKVKGKEGADAAIDEGDQEKFIQMRELIGLAIENTNSISQTIDVTLNIQSYMSGIEKVLGEHQASEAAFPMPELLNAIKATLGDVRAGTLPQLEETHRKLAPSLSVGP